MITVSLTVNGQPRTATVEPRRLLSDLLRHDLGLTGTHVGCEHGVCGACTILWNGQAVRSCLALAGQAEGAHITTVEGLSPPDGGLSVLQQAFRDAHALQCGYCTPGMLATLTEFLAETPDPTEDQVRHALSGNLCRCTGYEHIVDAALLAAARLRGANK
jgi:aerobic-type carbon monoxide dehydrogenase small subunit (CoxS/CutS family)